MVAAREGEGGVAFTPACAWYSAWPPALMTIWLPGACSPLVGRAVATIDEAGQLHEVDARRFARSSQLVGH